IEPPEGPGLDQGATATLEEQLGDAGQPSNEAAPASGVMSRTYIGVGINKSGRKGPISKRAAVPLVPAPPPPTMLQVSYDETAVTVTWMPAATSGSSYNVYE